MSDRRKGFTRENAVRVEAAAKTISPLHYGGIAVRACQVVSLSLLPRIIYARVWCTCARRGGGGWRSSIVPTVQSTDNVPGGRPTLPTNLAIVRACLSCVLYQIPRCMSASAGRVPILKFHSGRRKRDARELGWGRIAERAIYSNRVVYSSLRAATIELFRPRTRVFAPSLPRFPIISYVKFRPKDPLSVLTAYSFIVGITASMRGEYSKRGKRSPLSALFDKFRLFYKGRYIRRFILFRQRIALCFGTAGHFHSLYQIETKKRTISL